MGGRDKGLGALKEYVDGDVSALSAQRSVLFNSLLFTLYSLLFTLCMT